MGRINPVSLVDTDTLHADSSNQQAAWAFASYAEPMWLPQLVEELEESQLPTLFTGGVEHGVPYIIEALRARTAVAWLELSVDVMGDPVMKGNALAKAVEKALQGEGKSAPRLLQGVPFWAHLDYLQAHRDALPRVWLAFTTNTLDSILLRALLDMPPSGFPVVIDYRGEEVVPTPLRQKVRLVGPERLKLTVEEASQMLPRGVGPEIARELWQRTGGRFTELLVACHQQSCLPLPKVPAPVQVKTSVYVPPGQAANVVNALRRTGELVEAVEVAVEHAPELVEGLMGQAGHAFQQQGLMRRLYWLLSSLPEEQRKTETVLEWRFVAGFEAGDMTHVLPDVDEHLAKHSAPSLRARRAGTLPGDEGLTLALQAARTLKSPLTLWQVGRLHPEHEVAEEQLKESLRLAEDRSNYFEIARATSALVGRFIWAGQYGDAASWARLGLAMFDRGEITHHSRRLSIAADLWTAQLLTGDLNGLKDEVESALELATSGLPRLGALLEKTLAWIHLEAGATGEALALLKANYESSPTGGRAEWGYQYIRALLEAGMVETAERVASDVTSYASFEGASYESCGKPETLAALARGMVLAVRGDPAAAAELESVIDSREISALQLSVAALYYLVAPGAVHSRLPPRVMRLLRRLHPAGRRALSGPERLFGAIWDSLDYGVASLSLKFLDSDVTAVFEGEEIKLPQRMAEIALALVLNPDGLGSELLGEFLAGGDDHALSKGGVRATMARLRSLLPVSDSPYRLTVPFEADLLKLREHLQEGRVLKATQLYRQGLLPLSEARGAVHQREGLEEELRQAVLLSGNPDASYLLAERLGDDLEVWQSAVAALRPGDPRLAVARARYLLLAQRYGDLAAVAGGADD